MTPSEEHGWSGFREAFHKASEVTVLAAITEDIIVMAGGIALIGTYLTWVTGKRENLGL